MTTDHPADDCWLCKARAQFEPMGYSLVRTDDLEGLRDIAEAARGHVTIEDDSPFPSSAAFRDLRAALEAKGRP